MTDQPDGAYDWPHAVGGESKARQWRLARGIHDTEMRSGDKIDELLVAYSRQEIECLRGLLEAAQSCFRHYLKGGYLPSISAIEAAEWLAAYDKLKGE